MVFFTKTILYTSLLHSVSDMVPFNIYLQHIFLYFSRITPLQFNKIVSETIGLRLKKIVATTTYAPADRFFRIELSRVIEATIYGFSILKLHQRLYQNLLISSIFFSHLQIKKYLYATQIDISLEADLKVFCFLYLTKHSLIINCIYSNTNKRNNNS